MTIKKPNYTQIPNVILDKLMKDMGEAELKVVMAVCRGTFGWHKQRKKMSLSYLQNATGLSRQGVLNGIDAAISAGIIRRRKSGMSWEYEIVLVNEVDYFIAPTSQRSRLVLVNEVDTIKKELKKETIKEKRSIDRGDDSWMLSK